MQSIYNHSDIRIHRVPNYEHHFETQEVLEEEKKKSCAITWKDDTSQKDGTLWCLTAVTPSTSPQGYSMTSVHGGGRNPLCSAHGNWWMAFQANANLLSALHPARAFVKHETPHARVIKKTPCWPVVHKSSHFHRLKESYTVCQNSSDAQWDTKGHLLESDTLLWQLWQMLKQWWRAWASCESYQLPSVLMITGLPKENQ